MRRALAVLVVGVLAGCPKNVPPEVVPEVAELSLLPGVRTNLDVTVADADGDDVVLTAGAEAGAVIVTDGGVQYTAPDEGEGDTLSLFASDGVATTTVEVPVILQDPTAFRDPVVVSSTEASSKSPSIAVTEDGLVHIVWHDFIDDPTALHHAVLDGDQWSQGTLDLGPDKVLAAKLIADGDLVHMLYDRYIEGVYSVMYVRHEAEAWSAPVEVGTGRRASLAMDPDGELHAVFFGEEGPVHAATSDGVWGPGDDLGIQAPYVNTIRLRVVGTREGVELGILLSPGETSYDMNVLRWTADGGWGPEEILFVSPFLGAEEPAGALGPDGAVHWIWAEQNPVDKWTFDIVEMTADDEGPIAVATESGFSGASWIVVPADDRPIGTWVNEAGDLGMARFPYEEPVLMDTRARGPSMALDSDGFTHIAWFAVEDGFEQIGYTTNRP